MPFFKSARAPFAAALIAVASVASGLPGAALAQASAPAADAAAAATAPAPVAAPAPATAPTISKETVDNPYGLKALWTQGDFVARGTLIILVIMTMGSWYIIFTKLFEQRKLIRSAKAADRASGPRARSRRASNGSTKAARSATSPKAGSRPATTTKARWSRQIDKHTWISDERAARGRQHPEPAAGRPGVPGHGGLDRAVRRPVRHRLGHLPRARPRSASPARRRSTRSPARWARR